MKYKEFVVWCNQRICDACWGFTHAAVCIGIMRDMKKIPFWRREKYWKKVYEAQVIEQIVNPINEHISR